MKIWRVYCNGLDFGADYKSLKAARKAKEKFLHYWDGRHYYIRAIYIATALSVFAVPAQAQVVCVPHDVGVASLAAVGERIVAVGLLDNNPFYIYANPETGAWTAVVGLVDQGNLCMLAEGQGWRQNAPTVPGKAL